MAIAPKKPRALKGGLDKKTRQRYKSEKGTKEGMPSFEKMAFAVKLKGDKKRRRHPATAVKKGHDSLNYFNSLLDDRTRGILTDLGYSDDLKKWKIPEITSKNRNDIRRKAGIARKGVDRVMGVVVDRSYPKDGFDPNLKFKHPSYGAISILQCMGGPRALYGHFFTTLEKKLQK